MPLVDEKRNLGIGCLSGSLVQEESKGYPALDNWTDIGALNSQAKESTGSPDQKPIALYERMIKASSNENDLVLGSFCGCATTIIAANNLKRRWIGIDRRVDAHYHTPHGTYT